MQSLSGNKYMPRLGVLECESDGQSVIKFHNITSGQISSPDFQSLGGKILKLGTLHKSLLIYFLQLHGMPTQVAHIEPHEQQTDPIHRGQT